jgi:hypothetical protein
MTDPTSVHPAHLCARCWQRADKHATLDNPYVPAACPVGPFPSWTATDDREPSKFDHKVERYWRKSTTTFTPR